MSRRFLNRQDAKSAEKNRAAGFIKDLPQRSHSAFGYRDIVMLPPCPLCSLWLKFLFTAKNIKRSILTVSRIIACGAVLLFLTFPATSFAQIAPGGSCTPNGVSGTTSNGGNSHWMVCQAGTWQAVFSHNSAGAVTKIGNQTCTNGQILKFNGTTWACAADATGLSALPALTSARIWVGNASNTATAVALSGDATLSNAGALTIANNAVTSAKIANGTIANADIADATIVATTKLSATGTKNATTFLRGDNTWAVPENAGGSILLGTLCGLAYKGGSNALNACNQSGSLIVSCQGSDVRSSCPSGYTRRILSGVGSHGCMYTCSKN